MRMPRSLVRRVRELPSTVADGLLAALLTLLALPRLFLDSEYFERLDIQFREPGAVAVLLLLCQTVPLAWRRRAPYAVLAVTWAAATTQLALGYTPTFAEAAISRSGGWPTRPSWRRSPPSWPRSRSSARAGRWPRSGAGSPASCTTWSPTRSA